MEKVYKGRTQAETSPIVCWVYENGKWIYRELTREEWEAIVQLEVGVCPGAEETLKCPDA